MIEEHYMVNDKGWVPWYTFGLFVFIFGVGISYEYKIIGLICILAGLSPFVVSIVDEKL